MKILVQKNARLIYTAVVFAAMGVTIGLYVGVKVGLNSIPDDLLNACFDANLNVESLDTSFN